MFLFSQKKKEYTYILVLLAVHFKRLSCIPYALYRYLRSWSENQSNVENSNSPHEVDIHVCRPHPKLAGMLIQRITLKPGGGLQGQDKI